MDGREDWFANFNMSENIEVDCNESFAWLFDERFPNKGNPICKPTAVVRDVTSEFWRTKPRFTSVLRMNEWLKSVATQ